MSSGGSFDGVSADRRFENPNAVITSCQLGVCWQYLGDDATGATFRLLKAVVPQTRVFEDHGDHEARFAEALTQRKLCAVVTQMWNDDGTEADVTQSYFLRSAYELEQFLWKILKQCLRRFASPREPLVPMVLKYREVCDRLAHHLHVDVEASLTEVTCILHS